MIYYIFALAALALSSFIMMPTTNLSMSFMLVAVSAILALLVQWIDTRGDKK